VRFLPFFRPKVEARSLAEFDMRKIAAEAGCDVIETHELTTAGLVVLVLELDCRTNENAVAYLNGCARRDAWDPRTVAFAASLREPLGMHPSVPTVAGALQDWVKENIAFVRERDERFQHALVTLKWRMGDCDDHARLIAALLMACGVQARVVGVKNGEGRMAHVCAQVKDGGEWRWVETTVDAYYGEAPFDAARRLGLVHDRTEIAA
jgi:hypothetical protein